MTVNPAYALADAYNAFVEKYLPQNPIDTKTGRFVEPDKSVRPIRDTGFRMPAGVPHFTYNPPVKVTNDVFLPDYIHADDVIDKGPAFIRGEKVNAVRLISVNVEQHQAREAKYLAESIAKRKARADKAPDGGSWN